MDSAPSVRALLIAEATAYEHRGDLAGACRAYLAAGDSENAARVLVQLGRWRDAGLVLLRGTGWRRGKTRELEESQRSAGQRAAEHLAKGGDVQQAAEILVALGRRAHAVELLRAGGAQAEAAWLEAEGMAEGRASAPSATVSPASEGSGPAPSRSSPAMRAITPVAIERSAGIPEEAGTSYRMRRTGAREAVKAETSPTSSTPASATSPLAMAAPATAALAMAAPATPEPVIPSPQLPPPAPMAVALDLLPDLEFPTGLAPSVTQSYTRSPAPSDLGQTSSGQGGAGVSQGGGDSSSGSSAAKPRIGDSGSEAFGSGPAPDSVIMALAEGSLVAGRYRLGRLIGRGGFSAVFEATDSELDDVVAIKILASAASDGETLQRFKQEVAVARKVAHPNVLRLFDFGRAGPHAFITMELLKGEDLGAMLKRRGTLPLQEGLGLFVQVCDSLQALHSAGVVHRDIKPENFFVEETGTVKIMDFGIAKRVDARKGITITAKLAGTPQYMAPEQVNNFTGVTHLADLYALGCILYRAFTGVLPFDSSEIVPLLVMQVMDPPPPPRSKRPDIPPELEKVILKLLEKHPERRPASAHDVSVDLAGIRMRYR